jgi:hypothetical protein
MGHQKVAHCALSVTARCRLTHFFGHAGCGHRTLYKIAEGHLSWLWELR